MRVGIEYAVGKKLRQSFPSFWLIYLLQEKGRGRLTREDKCKQFPERRYPAPIVDCMTMRRRVQLRNQQNGERASERASMRRAAHREKFKCEFVARRDRGRNRANVRIRIRDASRCTDCSFARRRDAAARLANPENNDTGDTPTMRIRPTAPARETRVAFCNLDNARRRRRGTSSNTCRLVIMESWSVKRQC